VSLQGHTDWIRSIQIVTFTGTKENQPWTDQFNDGDLVVATSSQDKYIRLWKVSDIVEKSKNENKDSTLDMMEALQGAEM
jgi:elongator complex protein 2